MGLGRAGVFFFCGFEIITIHQPKACIFKETCCRSQAFWSFALFWFFLGGGGVWE